MSTAAKDCKVVALPVTRQSAPGAVALARVLAREGDSFRVRWGARDRLLPCDPSVDPALIETAITTGARVVVEDGLQASIVGALATARSVSVDRDDRVLLAVKRFEVSAGETVLKSEAAFVSLKDGEVEIFGRRILSRARELARILARAIQLN
jgi:hypothetical protein